MKSVVHLAYTVPLGSTLPRRSFDKVMALAHLPPLYRGARDALIPWRHPIRAPHSITHNLIRAIRGRGYDVRLYSFYERTVASMRPGDIFIGQPLPGEGMGATRATYDDRASVTSRTIRECPGKHNFIMMPYAHDAQYSTFAKELIRENNRKGGGAVFIGGKIWERDWEARSPLASLGSLRKVHLTEMGIDTTEYRVVKRRFNPKGKRAYLYIGHTAWYKNTAELERIAARMPEHEFAHIGGGEVRGWKKLANFATLTPAYAAQLAEKYDVFVNVSTADPQATTIIEQMCFGLAVASTPETGYDYPTLTMLSTTDTEKNVQSLLTLQNADESELLSRAQESRRIVGQFHTWNQFTKKVLDFVGVV